MAASFRKSHAPGRTARLARLLACAVGIIGRPWARWFPEGCDDSYASWISPKERRSLQCGYKDDGIFRRGKRAQRRPVAGGKKYHRRSAVSDSKLHPKHAFSKAGRCVGMESDAVQCQVVFGYVNNSRQLVRRT